MQHMQRGNDKLTAYLVFQTKLAAAQIMKEILKLRDIAVSLNDQIKDYNHLAKTNFCTNTNDTRTIQQLHSKSFMDSPWGAFIKKNDSSDGKISFYSASQQLAVDIEELKKIKLNYKKIYKHIAPEDKAVNFDKDKFVLAINHAILTAEKLICDLGDYNIDKYKKKAEDIIKKSSLPNNNGIKRIKITLDENTKKILIELKERELNFSFRNLTIYLEQIFDLTMSYIIMSGVSTSINQLTEKLSLLCEKLANGKNLQSLSATEKEIDVLMTKNKNEIELNCIKFINLHMTLHECGKEVIKFSTKLNSLTNLIINDLAKMREIIAKNDDLANTVAAIQRVMSVFRDDNAYTMDTKNNFVDDFNHIDKAYNLNSHLKKIKALPSYLNTIRMALSKGIDFSRLVDLRNIYYLIISDHIGAISKLSEIENKDIAAICQFKIVYSRLSALRSMIQQDFKDMLTNSSTDNAEESLSHSSTNSPISLDLTNIKPIASTSSSPASAAAATPTYEDDSEDEYISTKNSNK